MARQMSEAESKLSVSKKPNEIKNIPKIKRISKKKSKRKMWLLCTRIHDMKWINCLLLLEC